MAKMFPDSEINYQVQQIKSLSTINNNLMCQGAENVNYD